jgi:hypothetical protein
MRKARSRQSLVRYPIFLSPHILRSHKADLRHLTFQIPAYAFAYLDSCLAILSIYLLAKLRPFPEAVDVVRMKTWLGGLGEPPRSSFGSGSATSVLNASKAEIDVFRDAQETYQHHI